MIHAIFKMIPVLVAENFFVKNMISYVILSCRHLKSRDLKSLRLEFDNKLV